MITSLDPAKFRTETIQVFFDTVLTATLGSNNLTWKDFCLAVCLILPATDLRAERDAGSSHNLLLKAQMNDDWFFISRSNLATRDDFGQLFLGFTGGGLGYQLTDDWSIRFGYRHVWFRPQSDWLEEDRLFLEAYYANSFEDLRLTSRSRFEYRLFDYREDYLRFRNEFVLESTTPFGDTGFHPYLEEEFFYNTRDNEFEANWLGAGLAWRPRDGLKLKLGYRWNYFRVGDEWRSRDVLVTGINLFF